MVLMKTKITAILAVLVIAATISACGAEQKVTPQVTSNATTTTAATTTPAAETTPEETTTTPPEEVSATDTTANTAQMMESESEESTSTETTIPETEPIIIPDSEQPASSANGDKIADGALLLLDIPFAEGGTDPATGFDSSGFIYYIMKINGFDSFARGLNSQISEAAVTVSYDELQRGDAVYFTTADDHSKAQFGGIYIGDGKMVFSSTNGTVTSVKDISSQFWKDCFVTAVRVG